MVNGYDDLLQAAEMLHLRTGFYDEMPAEELNEVVAHNRAALDMVRQALEKEIAVPVDWSRDPAAQGADPAFLEQLQSIRQLGRALVAESLSNSNNDELDFAIRNGLDTYRLGTKGSNGGLIVHFLVGSALRTMAIEELSRHAANHPESRESILQQLSTLVGTCESAEEVGEREIDYIEHASRGLMGWVIVRNTRPLLQQGVDSMKDSQRRTQAAERLLLVSLALKQHQEMHGSWPDSLDQLPAEINRQLLLDPYGSETLKYRRTADDFQLYSVGVNGVDDAGRPDDLLP